MASKITLGNFFVIILAAGMGRRLGKYGKHQPKTLIKVKDKTILDRLIITLKKYKYNKVHFVLGYKYEKILKTLNNSKIKFSYSISKKFNKTGHGYSWLLSEKRFKKNSLPVLLIHADILFSDKYLKNIINSKLKNIIGSRKINKKIKKKNIYKISVDDNYKVNRISKKIKHEKSFSEVIGMNKFSYNDQLEIFKFLKLSFKDRKNIKLGWEDLLNKFIIKSKANFYVLKNQDFDWVNLNRIKDISIAKKSNFN